MIAHPSSPATAAFLRGFEAALLSELVDAWLALLRGPTLVEFDVRRAMPDFDRSPGVGIVVLVVNDFVRFVGNDLLHRVALKRRMVRDATSAGIDARAARRLVRVFLDAYDDAARFTTDVEHQRATVRRALGL